MVVNKFIFLSVMQLFGVFFSVASVEQSQRLPDSIVRSGQYIITDLDGTMIDPPQGNIEPELDTSPCFQPLLEWLSAGGRVVAITGNDASRMTRRFFQHIPPDLRANNQVILVANGGSVFYGSDSQGNLCEDEEFRNRAIEGGTVIAPENIECLVMWGTTQMNRFFDALRRDADLRNRLSPRLHFLIDMADERNGRPFTPEELLSFDPNSFPRIELRKIMGTDHITQVAIIGIPAHASFTDSPGCFGIDFSELASFQSVEIKQMNSTLEIGAKGVNKALPVKWMMHSSTKYGLIPQHCVSFGDAPRGNDQPLAELASTLSIPFISVAPEKEKDSGEGQFYVGQSCDGTARVMQFFLETAYKAHKQNDHSPIIPTVLKSAISSAVIEQSFENTP